MGAVRFSLRDYYDSTTEIVGIKSGILLNRFQVKQILIDKFEEDYLRTDNLELFVRVRVGELEEMLLALRQKIGNLPQILPTKKDYKYLDDYMYRTGDIETISASNSIGLYFIKQNEDINAKDLANLIRESEGFEQGLCEAIANISLERYDLSCIVPESKKWNDSTELSKLFDCEISSNSDFLEQRFLDYLAVNGNEIEQIHWRNFERFCAEYFKRQGYKVILGPGTNDGGIDIRVFNENNSAPDIIIQCKRYKTENKVQIETVKSFYTDVMFENAKSGLIATTGYIASGGKKVCETRGYNIKFAENENVKKWAREMWTYK